MILLQHITGLDARKLRESNNVHELIAAMRLKRSLLQSEYKLAEGREAAARRLAVLKDPRTVKALIKMVRSKKNPPGGRAEAARLLGTIGDPNAVEPVISLLYESNAYLRLNSCEVLGKLGDHGAIDPLISVLMDANATVREKAASALDLLGWKPGKDEIGAAYWAARMEWSRCAEIGTPAFRPLINGLNTVDRQTRFEIVCPLGQIGDPRAVEPLVGLIKQSGFEQIAAFALGMIGSVALPELISVLQDNNPVVRAMCCQALMEIADIRAADALCSLLKDQKGFVRRKAAEALDRLGWQPGSDEAGIDYWIARENWTKCIEIGAPAVPALIAIPKDPSFSASEAVVRVLGQIGDTRAVEPLIRELRSDWLTKAAAAESLGKLGDARAIEPLIPLLKDSKWPVRKAAAESLVSLFRTQGLSDKAKARVLQMKSTVTTTHLDQRVYERASSDCNILHTDSGIGVEFPEF